MKENIVWNEMFDPLDEIGFGGSSRVLKVIYKPDGKIYALKIMNFELNDPSKASELNEFYREVEFLKKLRHKSIVSIIDDFLIDNKPAILMEYVEGKSLAHIIREKKYLKADEVIEIAKQISAGLLACHNDENQSQSIIHNDIHSKNIIKTFDDEGNAQYKLIDFGLSFGDAEKTDKELKIHGMKEYKSPEKWQEEKVGTQSDIYSFGVVLYEMLAGQVPYPIDNYEDLTQELRLKNQVMFEVIPDIWTIRREKIEQNEFVTPDEPDFPFWLNNLVLKCLAKNSAKRYRSGRELNEKIYAGINGNLAEEWDLNYDFSAKVQEVITNPNPQPQSVQPTPPKPPTRTTQAVYPEKKKKNSWKWNVISLALITFAAGAYVKSYQSNSQENIEEIVREYYRADALAIDETSVDVLLEHFDFPIYYYNGIYSKNEFRKFYLSKLNVKKKETDITNLTVKKDRKPTLVLVNGKFKTFKNSDDTKANYVGEIKDEITISKRKIKRIVKE